MYLFRRNRRLRINESIRSLVKETNISSNDFITPLFIVEGKGIKEEITSMPNYYRFSLDLLVEEVKLLWKLGLKSVLLFVKIQDHLKDNKGTEAINPNGLMPRAIKTIKNACPEMLIMTDVALDPYSSFGHDGIIENGKIANDATVEVLAKMSVTHAQAGANVVAPSDMMDGRIFTIRKALDHNHFIDTAIMSYSVKYASAYYGPFREALNSAPAKTKNSPKDKKTYQMDFANRQEALKETQMDISEGADIVMIKPGLPYLDIIRDLKNEINIPVAVYQVSGEYAMIKAAAEKGWLDHDAIMMEQLMAFKRAGANLIVSYFSKEAVTLLNQ